MPQRRIYRLERQKVKSRDGKTISAFWSKWRDSFASAPKGADRGSARSSPRRRRSSALHLIFRVSHSKDKSRESKCSFGFFGPSGETRTRGILLPKQARYQLRYTWITYTINKWRKAGALPVAVPGIFLGAKRHRHLPTAATRSPRCICHRQRSGRSPTALHLDTNWIIHE